MCHVPHTSLILPSKQRGAPWPPQMTCCPFCEMHASDPLVASRFQTCVVTPAHPNEPPLLRPGVQGLACWTLRMF